MESILDLLNDKPEQKPEPIVESLTLDNTELIKILDNLKKDRWDEYSSWTQIYFRFLNYFTF